MTYYISYLLIVFWVLALFAFTVFNRRTIDIIWSRANEDINNLIDFYNILYLSDIVLIVLGILSIINILIINIFQNLRHKEVGMIIVDPKKVIRK